MLERLFPDSAQLLKLVGEALLVLDKDGVILHAAPPADALFGTEPGALPGTAFGVPSVAGEYSELDLLTRGGDWKIVQMRAIAAKDGDSDVYVVTLRDVTAEKRLEEELESARKAATVADRAKSNFLANMTHEIRTPMIGVLGMTDLTLATELTPQQREYLEMARHSADSLLDILNDILDYAKIETGKLELAESEFNIRETVNEAIRVFAPLAEKKGLKLAWTVADAVPPICLGDPGRLRQILVNLVGNAVKFTDQGSVQVDVRPSDEAPADPDGRIPLLFSVSDTGIGIPKDKLGAIFDSFTQADGSTSRRYQGAGLGLAIFKHLVEMMDGEVGVSGGEGRGSVFFFTLPLKPAEHPEIEPVQAPVEKVAPPPLTILLAEDNPINQIFISELLTQQGHKVITAHTGRRAVDALKRHNVDVVLMDIQMPVMDGMEATRIIRSGDNGRFDPDIPIIALTAHALKGDRERFLQAGMNDYLAKPVDLDDLLAALAGATGKGVATQADVSAWAAAAVETPRHVLDYPWLLEKARGNTDFLARLFAAFVSDQPSSLLKMKEALDAGDLGRLGFLAHSLKGAAATMGAGELKEACLKLEKTAKAQSPNSALAFKNLQTAMDHTVAAMQSHLEEPAAT